MANESYYQQAMALNQQVQATANTVGQALDIDDKNNLKWAKKGAQEIGEINYAFNEKAAEAAWEKTLALNELTYKQSSAAEQRKRIEEAGLSVGLMYGGSGQGGSGSATTAPIGGGASGTSPNVSKAHETAMARQNAMALGLQMEQQKAQVELTKAQTENVEANTNKTEGVDTKSTEANIESITAGTKGQELKNAMQELQNDMAKETRPWVIQQQISETFKAGFEAIEAQVGAEVSKETKEAKIQALINNVALQAAEYELKQSQIDLTEENKKAVAASIEQEWNRVAIQELEQKINKENSETRKKELEHQKDVLKTRNAELNEQTIRWREQGENERYKNITDRWRLIRIPIGN